MQISCERCATVYVLDDRLIPPSGAPVQCTRCGLVFTAKPSGSAVAPAPAPAPKPTAPPRSAAPQVSPERNSTQIFGAPAPPPRVPPSAPATTTQMFGAPVAAPATTTQMFGAPVAAPATTTQMFGAPVAAPAPTTQMFGAPPAAQPGHATQIFGAPAAPAKAPAGPATQTFGAISAPPAPASPAAPAPHQTQMFGTPAAPHNTPMFGAVPAVSAGPAAMAGAPAVEHPGATSRAAVTFFPKRDGAEPGAPSAADLRAVADGAPTQPFGHAIPKLDAPESAPEAADEEPAPPSRQDRTLIFGKPSGPGQPAAVAGSERFSQMFGTPAMAPARAPSATPVDSAATTPVETPAVDAAALLAGAAQQSPVDPLPAEYPAADYPATGYPAADYPATGYPATDYPAADYPAADYPAADYPAADYPAADYLAAEAPAPMAAPPEAGPGIATPPAVEEAPPAPEFAPEAGFAPPAPPVLLPAPKQPSLRPEPPDPEVTPPSTPAWMAPAEPADAVAPRPEPVRRRVTGTAPRAAPLPIPVPSAVGSQTLELQAALRKSRSRAPLVIAAVVVLVAIAGGTYAWLLSRPPPLDATAVADDRRALDLIRRDDEQSLREAIEVLKAVQVRAPDYVPARADELVARVLLTQDLREEIRRQTARAAAAERELKRIEEKKDSPDWLARANAKREEMVAIKAQTDPLIDEATQHDERAGHLLKLCKELVERLGLDGGAVFRASALYYAAKANENAEKLAEAYRRATDERNVLGDDKRAFADLAVAALHAQARISPEKRDKGLAAVKAALANDPKLLRGHLLQARLHFASRDYEPAKQALTELLVLNPNHVAAKRLQAEISDLETRAAKATPDTEPPAP